MCNSSNPNEFQVSRVTDRWKEDNDEIRESLGDVEDSVGRVEEDCKAKGMQIDVLSDQARRISLQLYFHPLISMISNYRSSAFRS